MVYAKFGGQTECIMGNWKIENGGQNNVEQLRKPSQVIITYDSTSNFDTPPPTTMPPRIIYMSAPVLQAMRRGRGWGEVARFTIRLI